MTYFVHILNGVNLNMLGQREPEVYGHVTLAEIDQRCQVRARALGLEVICQHTNAEHEMIGWIHDAHTQARGVIINAGAWSHTSLAIGDALKILRIPIIEVHLSNPARREAVRHTSYVGQVARGSICGLGDLGYMLALDAMASMLSGNKTAG